MAINNKHFDLDNLFYFWFFFLSFSFVFTFVVKINYNGHHYLHTQLSFPFLPNLFKIIP